jgi:hypothetical protein
MIANTIKNANSTWLFWLHPNDRGLIEMWS